MILVITDLSFEGLRINRSIEIGKKMRRAG
jgi:hypothetical protein